MAKSGGPVGIRFLGAIRRKMVAVSLVSRQASGHFSMIGDFAISITFGDAGGVRRGDTY